MSLNSNCVRAPFGAVSKWFYALLIFFVGGVFLGARAEEFALVGGTIYTAPGAAPIADGVVHIRDGKIVEVGPREQVRLGAEVRRIDCAGRWIVAGFWNCHVHLFTPELLHAETVPTAKLQEQIDLMLNRWGFTHVFDIASQLKNTQVIRNRIRSGEVRGPEVLTVGFPLWTSMPIYVRGFFREHGIEGPEVTGAEDAAARASEAIDGGADGVKLFTGSMQGEGAVANMSGEVVKAAARVAHARGLPVFAHPQNDAGLDVAIEGGVDILAHTTPQTGPWTEARVQQLKEANIALIPTLTLFKWEGKRAHMPPSAIDGWLSLMIGELRAFSSAGGEVLFGTDIGYIDDFDTTQEFAYMSEAAMDFPQVLASLTTAPAKRFGRGVATGKVAAGSPADVVVLKADPAAKITALAAVELTVTAGKITYQERGSPVVSAGN